MSGHSHWATIKHKKGAADAKRGKEWSKCAKYIMVAAKKGGADPEMNLSLQYAIQKARAVNMPKDNIERAIKRGTGENLATTFEEALYEGYGPGGVALIVEILTDNKNRTASEVRKIFELRGGQLGKAGSVAWMFEKKGFLAIAQDAITEEALMDLALEAGAEDFKAGDGVWQITTEPAQFEAVRKALAEKKLELQLAEVALVPKAEVSVDAEVARKAAALIEALEDQEDVQNVYANFTPPAAE